ncbi:helix-turn-helix domain-containing protein [Falsiroseomonas sp.]|uniref:helix-turn-helix domain-containing protein n=1 Tax=Falsiroseomonas sp. TaxID=2870721 RepID=UPI00351E0E58
MVADWHPEDIKAAIRKTGITMRDLSRQHGLCQDAVKRTLACPWPRVQAIVAAHLKTKPHLIWPSRYDRRGRPLAGLRASNGAKVSRPAQSHHRQKLEAA